MSTVGKLIRNPRPALTCAAPCAYRPDEAPRRCALPRKRRQMRDRPVS